MNVNQIQAMKGTGKKSAALVVWDAPTAHIAHECGADFLIVGDSVGVNLWGHSNNLEITLDDFLVAVKAVRRGAPDALVCADIPYGPVQIDPTEAVRAAIRLVQEGGADLVKIDAAPDFPEAVSAVNRAGVPVFAQMGLSPQSGSKYGISIGDLQQPESLVPDEMMEHLIQEARICEQAGAAMIDLTNAGPVIGEAITDAVGIPVIGGMGGGPWLDGRIRMFHAAVGYGTKFLDNPPSAYAYIAQTSRDAVTELLGDIRSGKQIKGGLGRK